MKLFCQVLKLIHFIVTALIIVYDYLITIKEDLINYLRPKTLKCIDTIVDVCDVSKLEKLPNHLVIVVASKDKVSFSDLAKIVGWCCTLGIPNITFYDREGIIYEKSELLINEFNKLTPSFVSRVIWSNKITRKFNTKANGEFKQYTRVNFSVYNDGKPEIIKLTRELSQAVKLKLLKTDDINYDLINEKLSLPVPDPDLAIITGRTFSTFGLLPWHIRLTEFYNVPTHHNISPHKFIQILEEFAKCHQRFGT
ncbi:hypothetical protein G9C98_000690 [Cotesia typhae]|uniref:ditrans,polycis-polyprenyl diphosphate synthase [(2E,6E)-farnesyldiphosphate specific] n=1 Tax=Cotesia typhae TaxID=2053667 RepID=A0A8J5R5M2_9HYME|nr:hypothetical protein G9C98_000690 [Cotesia typhae]